jgi:hypothetical protein
MLRNPRTLNAAFFNAVFIGLLTLALYYKVGDISTYKEGDDQKAVNNWVGLSFLLANNLMFPSLMLVII